MSPTGARGEVWLVNLDPTIGDEIRKVRPAIFVNRDALSVLSLRIVVPITAWQERFKDSDWLVRIDPDANNGLDKISGADTFQVRSVSIRRCVRRLGQLSQPDVIRVDAALKAALRL
jgi:mRNA interferase MazF